MGLVELALANRLGPGMSFDHLAPHYRWMEAMAAGELLQRCRTVFVGEIDGDGHVLLLGIGRGRFLTALRRRHPRIRVTAIDASARMLQLARQDLRLACGSDEGVEFVHADILSWTADGQLFDAVASHFFLDCFRPEQLRQIAGRVAACSRAGAPWLVTDFCIPETGWRRWRARAVHAMMYGAFRVMTNLAASQVTPPDSILSAAGFMLRRRVHASFGLLHSDLWVRTSA